MRIILLAFIMFSCVNQKKEEVKKEEPKEKDAIENEVNFKKNQLVERDMPCEEGENLCEEGLTCIKIGKESFCKLLCEKDKNSCPKEEKCIKNQNNYFCAHQVKISSLSDFGQEDFFGESCNNLDDHRLCPENNQKNQALNTCYNLFGKNEGICLSFCLMPKIDNKQEISLKCEEGFSCSLEFGKFLNLWRFSEVACTDKCEEGECINKRCAVPLGVCDKNSF